MKEENKRSIRDIHRMARSSDDFLKLDRCLLAGIENFVWKMVAKYSDLRGPNPRVFLCTVYFELASETACFASLSTLTTTVQSLWLSSGSDRQESFSSSSDALPAVCSGAPSE